MSEEDKTIVSKPSAGPNSPRPESPTTARPLEFDDEFQETGVTSAPASTHQTATEAAPPKPPRPLSPQQQAESTLKEAFPTIETSVVKAVLVASGYDVERAFHALLGMTDPNAQEEVLPPKPPRPSAAQRQLEADELYARQLAEHYNRRAQPPPPHWENDQYRRQRRESEQSEEKEYNFFDDDLPVIRENIRKGFLDTQTKVNSWVQNLKKRLDGEEEDAGHRATQSYGEDSYGRSRRSGDRERYDADPQVLSDDFSALELRDGEAPPPRPPRPLANPNLYKTSLHSPDTRKVSFQDGPPTEIGSLYDASEPVKHQPAAGGKPSKWQPLSTVEPSPIGDNDPFSLGDSDDERDTKAKDQTPEESDRVKKAATEATAGELNTSSKG
ncbi:hypothetical protein P175DRAFT_0498956 [Aspergillus ochraceoroseus IBT 24754]|uniref:CUE domain-containing protein n=3 Tax=Aspergillus subgen. Nidulantes TaxID=2720870 RepID=A0A0F8UYP8_9EURO|nr:uncharacterized protein P175DRAFT_0498956 [Aspergillus ochraceoroseus IBT 24754]KKK15916.1 hypothetical protein ARAM_006157 [Aspergillus rambellii]KKK21667.1 hypothetical protein AOCH_004085 [Aspergillus ochraceoroseus]PTU22420.1 hypothetical protein P175DRAFT_0498956 [Aspergillus ochraceoroseus IBT 24754]